ncbi:MAG: cyclase family protein [Solirubrobacterales bacterium]
MPLIDLTREIIPEMPVLPGTEPPRIDTVRFLAQDGYAESRFTFYTHIGTHVDAPAHLIKGGRPLHTYPIEQFIGQALVLDCSSLPDLEIPLTHVRQAVEPLPAAISFLLIRTGWSRHWGSEQYFQPFTVLSAEAAKWLAAFPLKGVGVDAFSVDSLDSTTLPIHHAFLNRDILILENLANLEALPDSPFELTVLPLKARFPDGAPVRAVARVR